MARRRSDVRRVTPRGARDHVASCSKVLCASDIDHALRFVVEGGIADAERNRIRCHRRAVCVLAKPI
jgi:hypothetical protein